MPKRFATFGADTLTKKQTIRTAGLTHAVIPAFWDALQPSGAATALNSTAVTALNQQITDCISAGIIPILEHAVQYPPSWAASAVEQFKDQSGNQWAGTVGAGDQVRNWMWTATGRTYFADFVTKVYAALTGTNQAAVERIRFGGGYFGETQYPPQQIASPWSYWGFGTSMQTGTGLASGLTVCPQVGYTPFSGTDAQDVSWINWYLRGIENWILFQVATLKGAGWTVPLMCLHPGYSIRQNQVRTDAGFRQSMAYGHDFTRAVGCYKNDPQVWPWSTWINGADPFPNSTVDTDQGAWKKLYSEAAVRGKHYHLWGENTGGEDNTGLDFIFSNALAPAPATGQPPYFGANPGTWRGYEGLSWLNNADLTGGVSGKATLAHYTSSIRSTTYMRGVNDAGGDFSPSAVPGTYGTDYQYDSAASLTYLASRGHTVVRFPFLWERIQHTLGAALDATELARIQTYVSNAHAAGLGVILDVHNFCRYNIGGTVHVIGDGTLTQAHFVDLWTRLSTAFKGNSGIAGYGLMNEPHDLAPVTGTYTPGSTFYNFDASTQSWVEETGSGTVTRSTATTHDGAGSLQTVKAVSSGAPTIRLNDAANNTVVIGGGQTIAAWVQIASGTAGTWTAHMEMQNSSYSWQAGSDFSLTAGTWTQITYTPSSAIWTGHHGVGIQFTGSGISGTPNVTVLIDTVSQGSLTGSATAPQVWEQASQAAVTAIRGNSDTTPIMVAGYNYSSADTWATNHPAAWITDSANQTIYEAHLYFDDNGSGVYASSYSAEATLATGEGFASVTARATTRLGHFTAWLLTNSANGFIGEMGWPHGSDATSWNAVGDAVYTACDRAGLWVAYWSAGEFWGTGYALTPYHQLSSGQPISATDAQAAILEAHASVTGSILNGYGLNAYGTSPYGS